MKKCPYCAEEIQDEAKVCRHCGRDLVSTATVQKVEIVQPAKRTGCVTWFIVGFLVLMGTGAILSFCSPKPAPRPASTAPAADSDGKRFNPFQQKPRDVPDPGDRRRQAAQLFGRVQVT